MNQPSTRLRLRLSAAAEKQVRSGHPWVFSDSVRDQNRDGNPGELAAIYDRTDKFLAIGLFDPDSPIRVRILHTGKRQAIDAGWWRERLRAATARRDGLFDNQTNGHRWINGESDGWPGLVLDRYDTTLVLKLYSAAWLPRLQEIVALVRADLNPRNVVLRLSRNIQSQARNDFEIEDGQVIFGNHHGDRLTFRETGLCFEADVLRGQKTGFFLDQRENRRIVETFSRDREVLNAFSFSGGFSVYAARGGAKSVTNLDISAHALGGAERNFVLNKEHPGLARCRHQTIQADAFDWLEGNVPGKFDLIVLDPPSLAKREAERSAAIKAYGRLAQNGIAHLRPGGILVAASCSAHVSAKEFFGAVRAAAQKSRRKFAQLKTTGHAPDHPARFPEGHYLKCIFLKF